MTCLDLVKVIFFLPKAHRSSLRKKSLISIMLASFVTIAVYQLVSVQIFDSIYQRYLRSNNRSFTDRRFSWYARQIKKTILNLKTVPPIIQRLQLTICLITAQRQDVSYVEEVLDSIDQEMRSDINARVLVVDVSPSPTNRVDLQIAQSVFPHVAFQHLANKTDERCPVPDPYAHFGRPGNVSCAVRQQGRDVSAALVQCAAFANRTGWLILVEDDTPLCPGGLAEIAVVLATAQRLAGPPRHCNFRLVDFSRTFSGTAVPAALAPALAAHFADSAALRPVDHSAWDNWARGAAMQYSGNLLSHRGEVTLRGAGGGVRGQSGEVARVGALASV